MVVTTEWVVSADQRRLGPASPQPTVPSSPVILTSAICLPSSIVRDTPRASLSTPLSGSRTGSTSISAILMVSPLLGRARR